MAERRVNDRGQNQDDNAVPAAIRNSNMSEECIVLLEELIRSNRALASENEKLRQQQECSNKSNLEALQRIENRLETGENGAKIHRRQNRQKRRTIVVPPACRRAVRRIYKLIFKKDDFGGFYLDEEVNSDNNYGIFERTVEQVVHQQGGPEKCPWTKDIIEAALQRYFKTCLETHKLKSSNRYEAHKQKTRKSGRQREKLMRQTTAMELVNWADQHEKGRVAEVLVMEAMSSEESCYEDDNINNSKLTKYSVHRLQWESRRMKKIKKKLDKAYKKKLTSRAKERILPRVDGQPSLR